ncbi:TIGR02679 family protein [Selenomonas ruminantium]|uniref:TIGR02679 family protein n=1 Tax=Selenomonas ruminantium TaxID=971 RepID=A0A1H0S7X8_SELRU|nr:TIGR02679 family protein [Selenomonas ruminantium]SDP37901.1 TIGR02679 family protein [Selenomonas ruminantium]
MKDKLLAEAAAYFREHAILLKLAGEFCRKYRSLGHFGGRVLLSVLTVEEQRDLSAFLRRKPGKADFVSYKDFSAAWEKTRFGSIALPDFLLSLMPGNFMTKREERQQEQVKRRAIMDRLRAEYPAEPVRHWLRALAQGDLRLFAKDLYQQEDVLATVACALASLPEKYERLPLFANRVAKNPHALDFDRTEGRLFLQALAFLQGGHVPAAADERTELLYKYRLIRDDILNFATVYGLKAYAENGREIAYWRTAAEVCAPLNVPLREIAAARQILPVSEKADAVYIVENSGVFSTLLDGLQARQKTVPLVALHGQLKAASWALLDRLAAGGFRLLYAGDFDPEGLSIASHILNRYEGAALWHMSVNEYAQANLPLPENRLKKLPTSNHPQLTPLVAAMRHEQKVLYQESLLQKLQADLWNK